MSWFRVRMGLLAILFLAGLLAPFPEDIDLPPRIALFFLAASVFSALFMGFFVVMVIGVQAWNAFSAKTWERPTHASNPFQRRNPLVSFHFFAYEAIAAGLGLLCSSLWRGMIGVVFGPFFIINGLAVLGGIEVSRRLYKSKIPHEEPRCEACGYNLTGNVSGVCPECGSAIVDASDEPAKRPKGNDGPEQTIRRCSIAGWVLLVFVIPFGSGAIVWCSKTRSFVEQATRTEGTVVRLAESSSSDGTTYCPVFTFEDRSGNPHTVESSVSSSPPSHFVGEKVAVFYDPDDPDRAKIDSFIHLWLGPFVFGILAACALVGGIILLTLVPFVVRRLHPAAKA